MDIDLGSSNEFLFYVLVFILMDVVMMWVFYICMEFFFFFSNFVCIYLLVFFLDLKGVLNGYYVWIGGILGSDDVVELFW